MLPSRFARSRLAGFQCPCCRIDLPYKLTREMIFATIEERKSADDSCTACRQAFRLIPPTPAAQAQARRRWALSSVGLILLALGGLGLLNWQFPGLSGWLALPLGAVIGLAPLPLIEAWATRPMVDFRRIKRRGSPLAPPAAT